MIAYIKKLFSSKKPESKNDFSEFFLEKKSGDKVKIIRQALRDANEEQRTIMKDINLSKTTTKTT